MEKLRKGIGRVLGSKLRLNSINQTEKSLRAKKADIGGKREKTKILKKEKEKSNLWKLVVLAGVEW